MEDTNATARGSSRLREALVFGLKAFVVCSFLAAVYVAAGRLEGHALTAPDHAVALGAWSVVQAPDWVTDEHLLRVREDAGLATARVSVLDRDGPARLARRLADAPDVRRVLALERRLPNRLRVALELRRPAARVRTERPTAPSGDVVPSPRHDWLLVDRDGVLLGRAPRAARRSSVLPSVLGARVPVERRGTRLGPDVRAGVELSAQLARAARTHEALAPFDVVDVSNWAGRRSRTAAEVVVRSRIPVVASGAPASDAPPAADAPAPEPCRVEWGRVATRAHADEPDFAAKRDRLLAALAVSPGLRDFAVVRVAFDEPWVVPRVPR